MSEPSDNDGVWLFFAWVVFVFMLAISPLTMGVEGWVLAGLWNDHLAGPMGCEPIAVVYVIMLVALARYVRGVIGRPEVEKHTRKQKFELMIQRLCRQVIGLPIALGLLWLIFKIASRWT